MEASHKADLQELSEFVATHPDDNARRWTLAKKLYMAWEYNDALKHLAILKKNRPRKLNILRYLAATYYRLGLYDDAIAELRDITQSWPSEVAVWEQLARVYEVAGRTVDAAHTWEQVVRIYPAHPAAARSVQRLRSPSDDMRREDLRLRDSDSGIDLSPYRVCKSCGAQNSDEFERCWQCHAAFRSEDVLGDSTHEAGDTKNRAWLGTFICGMATVAAVSASVYIAVYMYRRAGTGDVAGQGPVYDLLAQALFVPRLVSAAVLIVVWPVALWCAFRVAGAHSVRWPRLFGAGLLFSATAYLAMWVPISRLIYAPLLPAAVSLVVVLWLTAGKVVPSAGAWLVQGIVVALAGMGAFMAIAGVQPVLQLRQVVAYSSAMSAIATPDSLPIFSGVGRGGYFLHWEPTESAWLNDVGRDIRIEAIPDTAGAGVRVELANADGPIEIRQAAENEYVAPIIAGARYTLRATAPEGVGFSLRSRGVLQPIIDGKIAE